jgi:UDPglucose 6-dehydrogenase
MKVVMIGTGYVGLVSGTCFSDCGNNVTCVDIDADKIRRLRQGEIPIYEPGLTEMVLRNIEAGRLTFTTDYAQSVPGADCVFIAVGTPQGDDGAANLNGLWAVVDTLAQHLTEGSIVVTKSTVPIGTNRKIHARLLEKCGFEVPVASNPEFLKEGAAIDDFMKPDRVVVGVTSEAAANRLEELHRPLLRTEKPFLAMGLESAEMTKYVSNCMLATKISFINEMANLCEAVGADVNEVRKGMGHDQRIGFSFLFPGVGYGGSCFPKDVRALIAVSEQQGLNPTMLQAVDDVNDRQKHVLFKKINEHFQGDLQGRIVTLWGLAFKPRTDDIREAPALVLAEQLLKAGAIVQVHDPIAIENVRQQFGDRLVYFEDQYDALNGSEALAIVTEWSEFRNPNFDTIKNRMSEPNVFDGRNIFQPDQMKADGFTYSGIGLLVNAPKTTTEETGEDTIFQFSHDQKPILAN